jgi:ubiquinone/menaquinone biosynthesis C-methylase UbiE
MFTTAYPATMSRRYDADFDAIYGGPDRGDIAFFVGLAGETSGSICEIGAGTGRVLFPVAHADPGRAVTAIEPSEAMRQCFEQNLHRDHPALVGRIALQAGSFQDIPLSDASQGYVFGAFRSFQHVLTVEDQLRALAEMKRVTQPGGLIAFDLFDPDYATLQTTEARCVAVAQGADGRVIERWDAFRIDRVAQLAHLHFRWIERDRDGAIVAIENDGYTVRYTFPQELLHLLARAGFEDVQLLGGHDRRPLGEVPDELIVLARVP